MTSIRDIAKKSGYAVSTVSRYINQSGYVSEETGQAIQAVIDQLDYRPNQLARDLSLGETRRLGIVVPHTRHPYFTELMRGLMDAAFSAHYQVLFLPSRYDEEVEISYLEQLRGKAFDGLLFTSRHISLEKIAAYHSYGSIVCLEETGDLPLSSVVVNRKPGYTDLFNWLQKEQVKKVALLFTRNDETSPTYRETMAHFQEILPQVAYETFGQITTPDDIEAIAELFVTGSFDAIVANSDNVAAALMQLLTEKTEKLPLILSQESQLAGELLQIPTIENHSYQLGRQAFELLISKKQETRYIDSQFINRQKNCKKA